MTELYNVATEKKVGVHSRTHMKVGLSDWSHGFRV
jgi:hypothetical protein